MADIISYERFCAARKAKIEKREEQEVMIDMEMLWLEREYYQSKDAEQDRCDYE